MDGGSVDNAGAIIDQYILYIVAPAHPCARDIQYILYIKKKASGCNLWPFYMNQCLLIKPYDSPAHRQ